MNVQRMMLTNESQIEKIDRNGREIATRNSKSNH
jgi:hypothetical protein